MKTFKQTIVISVGGSLIYPEDLDIEFLKRLREIIVKFIEQNNRIILVTGGGKLCRKYNQTAKSFNPEVDSEQLDWLGIRITKLNAELLRIIFAAYAYPQIIEKPNQRLKSKNYPVLVAGGWKPGASSDNMAVNLAKKFKANKLNNLTNIDYVYDKDPKKFPDAKAIEKITWPEFRELVGAKWDPGLNAPFDPIASILAQKLGLEVAILNGKNIWNLTSYLGGGSFIGTVIK